MKRSDRFQLPLLAILCAVLWGSAFPVIKHVYSGWESNSLELRLCFAGIRFALAGLLIVPFCFSSFARNQGEWKRFLFLLAFTQTFLQYIFFYSGLAVSSGVLGSILVGSGSLWWILLAPILLRTPPPTRRHLLVILMSMIGVVLAVYAPGIGSGSPLTGTLFFLAASLSGAVGSIVIVPLARLMDVRLATSGALFIGGLALFLCGIRALPQFWAELDAAMLISTCYLAGVSAGAFGIWNWLIREHSVNVLAGYRFLIPLSAVTQSTLFIEGESPGVGIFLGGGLILGALYYLQRFEASIRSR